MATDCRHITPLLSSYIDDELSAPDASAVVDHLRTCAACRARHVHLASARDAVRQWPKESVSSTFGEQLDARLANRGFAVTPVALGRSRRFELGLSVLALAAVLLLIVFVFQARRGTAPPASAPDRTSQADGTLGIDCGRPNAFRCHTEFLCSSAVVCGLSRAMPAFVDLN